jgi:O-antigen ligase
VATYAVRRAQSLGLSWIAIPTLGLILGASSVLAPNLALGLVVGVIFIALAMIDVAAGVAAFVLLAFFEQFPGVPASQLSVIKVAGAILVVAWLAHLAANRDTTPLLVSANPLVTYASVLLVGLALASILWAADPGIARMNAFRLAQGPILLMIVFSAIRTPRHFRWVLWAYFAGAVATAVVGIGKTPADAADVGRLSGGIRDPNELAAVLLPAIPIALFGMAAIRKASARWALGAGLCVILAALFMTGSRGGLVGLGVMFVAALVLSGPLRQQVLIGLMIVTGVAVVYYALFAPPAVLWRLTHFTAEGGSGRTDLWSIALAMFRDHPLLGVGAGNFQVVEPTYALSSINLSDVQFVIDTPRWVHNTYLHVLVELGLVGFVCLVLIVLGAFVAGLRSLPGFTRSGDRQTEILARGFLIGITGMLTAFVFLTAQYEKQLWLLLGVTMALQTVSRWRESEQSDALALAPVGNGSLSPRTYAGI